MTIIRMNHIRKAKMCSRGARAWCKANGIDWDDFLVNGVDSDILLQTGDARVPEVIEAARNG